MGFKAKQGSQHPSSVLDEDRVRAIRESYAQGYWTTRQLGSMYGVSAMTISRVVTRKLWRHVP